MDPPGSASEAADNPKTSPIIPSKKDSSGSVSSYLYTEPDGHTTCCEKCRFRVQEEVAKRVEMEERLTKMEQSFSQVMKWVNKKQGEEEAKEDEKARFADEMKRIEKEEMERKLQQEKVSIMNEAKGEWEDLKKRAKANNRDKLPTREQHFQLCQGFANKYEGNDTKIFYTVLALFPDELHSGLLQMNTNSKINFYLGGSNGTLAYRIFRMQTVKGVERTRKLISGNSQKSKSTDEWKKIFGEGQKKVEKKRRPSDCGKTPNNEDDEEK